MAKEAPKKSEEPKAKNRSPHCRGGRARVEDRSDGSRCHTCGVRGADDGCRGPS